jgi:hypothetical protein
MRHRLARAAPWLYRRAIRLREAQSRRRQRLTAHARAYPSNRKKHSLILEYARAHALRTFVETGTYTGETVDAVRAQFERVWTIELEPTLADLARLRFAPFPEISVLQGDSTDKLRDVLAQLHEPALFWLDGHVSTGKSARGEDPSPVLRELELILLHPVRAHVVLIDDARLLTGRDGWPALERLLELIDQRRPDLDVEVSNDVIRAVPRGR